VKQAIFALVNHAQIRSWNKPVLSHFLLKETAGAFHGAQIHDWQVSTDYESDALPTRPHHSSTFVTFDWETQRFCYISTCLTPRLYNSQPPVGN